MEEVLLKCHELSKWYGATPALKGLNLTVPAGRIVGLLGTNGSGKTTLIKMIAGLLTPTSGNIYIDGKVPGVRTKSIVSYLPDRTFLPDWMTVSEILKYYADFYKDFDKKRASQMLGDLSIPLTSRLKALSKGTKEKVQLILVMSRRAKLYLLDEPIGGVDPATRDYILNTIIQNYNPQSSIIISTHLISDVEKVLDNFLFVHEGVVVNAGSTDEVRQNQGKSLDELFREVFRC